MPKLKDDIKELVEAGVIDWETGDKISEYYLKEPKNHNRLLLAFGILAAILVGLGIILIMAHNWDNLSVIAKTAAAFLPLIIALCLAGFTLWKKSGARVWREVSGILLFFSVAAAIALIGQIYHVDGDTRSFIRIWLILALPIVYLLYSSAVSILILLWLNGLTISNGPGWVTNLGPLIPFDLLLIFLAIIPYYLHLCNTEPKRNFTIVHHWVMAYIIISVCVVSLGGLGPLGFATILCLFGILYGIGKMDYFKDQGLRRNPYLLLGTLGTVITLFVATFRGFWRIWDHDNMQVEFNFKTDYIILLLLAGALFFFYNAFKKDTLRNISPVSYSFLLFIPIYFIGNYDSTIAMLLTNLLLGGIGVYYIIYGNRIQRLAILNFGMVIISGLILCRFFEMDLSFVARGICFVLIGLAFFAANYFLIKNAKPS